MPKLAQVLLTAMLFTSLAAASGCQSQKVPKFDSALVGTWQREGDGRSSSLSFTDTGLFLCKWTDKGSAESSMVGRYRFDGEVLLLTYPPEASECADECGSYSISLLDGKFAASVLNDSCVARRENISAQWLRERLGG
ncbi:MAG: hypothetical protein EXS00_05230 [Phycisphaerales bacterium]|nr:hypothetical protein [Phycisphaerales bacterium]